MIKKIEDFVFAKSFSETKNFIKQFCESPSTSVVELIYITGATSKGKTDLLNIFGTELMLNNSIAKIKRIEANDIINHFLHSLDQHEIENFISHYLQFEIILIDDYESLNNRAQTTEMMIHFLNSLRKAGKKIILSCTDKKGLNSITKLLPVIKTQTIDLNLNLIDLNKLIKVKSSLLGLDHANYRPDSSDIREIEGFLKKEKFAQILAS